MKMKQYNIYTGLVFVAALLLNGCADDEKKPILTFEDMGKGGYPRLINLVAGEYDLNNLATTFYGYEVEFVTVDKGLNVTSYDVDAVFKGVTQPYRTFSQSDFVDSPDGLRSISVSIPLADMLPLFGLPTDGSSLAPLDKFTFDTRVTLGDGSSFTFDNSSAAVNGDAFQGHFRFSSTVTCPMPDADFAGSYTLDYVDAAVDGPIDDGGFASAFGPPATVTLETISGSTTKRRITGLGYLAASFGPFDMSLTIDFVCVVVTMTTQSTGVGCVDDITISQTNTTPFNINDDSTFELHMTEFPKDNGCGQNPKAVRYVLTKN